MTTEQSKELAKGAGQVALHAIAMVIGFVLMIAGVGLGVTLVMLPLGFIVGFAGLFVFLWGIFGRNEPLSRGS